MIIIYFFLLIDDGKHHRQTDRPGHRIERRPKRPRQGQRESRKPRLRKGGTLRQLPIGVEILISQKNPSGFLGQRRKAFFDF